jgi:hypothetical protein
MSAMKYCQHVLKYPTCFFGALLLAYFSNNLYSQLPSSNQFAHHTLYADFASTGAYYSVNYDRIFHRGTKFTKSWRAGLSLLKDVVACPLGIHFFTGQYASHAEFSITLVPYIEQYKNLFSDDNLSDKKIYIIPGTGYRYQPAQGGFFFKVVAAPVIYLDPGSDNFWKMDGKIYPGINLGAGFSF